MTRKDLASSYEALDKIRAELNLTKYDAVLSSYLVGEKYLKNNAPRLLVIGRAINGWPSEIDSLDKWEKQQNEGALLFNRFVWDKASKSYKPVSKNECRWLEWVGTYVQKGTSGKKRLTANVKFWKAACLGAKLVLPLSVDELDTFYKHIAWTNLYKLASHSGGNPTPCQRKAQERICIEILEKELEILKPTHVLVIAKANTHDEVRRDEWIIPFSKVFEKYKVCGGKVAFLARPEFKSDEQIEKEILSAFEL